MKEIKLSQGHSALVDDDWYEMLKYAPKVTLEKQHKRYRARIGKDLLHRIILDPPKGAQVDHADRNPLNNQTNNLRICTNSENSRNKSVCCPFRQSKFKGITYNKRKNIWDAGCTFNGRHIYLGGSRSEIKAAIIYNIGVEILHGRFAFKNEVIGETESVTPRKSKCKSNSNTKIIGICPRKNGIRMTIKRIFSKQLSINFPKGKEQEAAEIYDKTMFEWMGIESCINHPEKHLIAIRIKCEKELELWENNIKESLHDRIDLLKSLTSQ